MKNRHFLVYSIPFLIFAFVRVTRTSKAMQTTAIGTVVNSLPENKVILLTLLISKRYIPYTDLRRKTRNVPVGAFRVFSRDVPTANGSLSVIHRRLAAVGEKRRGAFFRFPAKVLTLRGLLLESE